MRKSIKSISGLYELLKEVSELDHAIYRGHSSVRYELKSSAFRRLEKKYKDKIKVKKNISSYHEQLIEEFKANKYHKEEIGELCDLEILAKLQHYGAATCFLDFSKSIAVALWFACNSKENEDGQIYIVKNIQDIINYKLINTEQLKENVSHFYEEIKGKEENELVRHFLLWEPPYLSERILQQDSIFLFSKREDELDSDEFIFKVVIDKKIKRDILKVLDTLFNINKKTIYKDFHGFAISHAQNEQIDFIDDGEKYFELANQYFQANKNEKAIEFYKKAESDINDDEILIKLYENLSYLYEKKVYAKDKKVALEYQNKALKIKELLLEQNHLSILSSISIISRIYWELGGAESLEKALEYQKRVVEGVEQNYNKKDLTLASSYNNISNIYQSLGGKENLEKALDYQYKVISILEVKSELKTLELGTSYNNISNIYQSLGGKENLEKALDYQKKAMTIREKVLESNHPELATSYNNIANIYLSLNEKEDLKKALDYQKKAIKIQDEVLEEKHPNQASCYCNISVIYYKIGGKENLLKALDYQKKAIEIREEVLEEDNLDLGNSYYFMYLIYLNLGRNENLKKALNYIEKVIDIYKKTFSQRSSEIQRFENEKKDILSQIK